MSKLKRISITATGLIMSAVFYLTTLSVQAVSTQEMSIAMERYLQDTYYGGDSNAYFDAQMNDPEGFRKLYNSNVNKVKKELEAKEKAYLASRTEVQKKVDDYIDKIQNSGSESKSDKLTQELIDYVTKSEDKSFLAVPVDFPLGDGHIVVRTRTNCVDVDWIYVVESGCLIGTQIWAYKENIPKYGSFYGQREYAFNRICENYRNMGEPIPQSTLEEWEQIKKAFHKQ